MSAGTARGKAYAREGWRGEALEPWLLQLGPALLQDPEALARSGRVLRESLHRVTARVVVAPAQPFLLKVHGPRAGLDHWLSWLRRGRARAEWDAARVLGSQQLPVPEPLAYGERRRFGLLIQGFFAARFLEDAVVLREALEHAEPAARAALLAQSAQLIADLHAVGFDHRDLHAGNVLVEPLAAGAQRLVITDLHRHRLSAQVGRRAQVDALARWLHSLERLVGPQERAAWLAAYARDPTRVADLSEPIRIAQARLERRWRRSRARRCQMESSRYTCDMGTGRGARSRAISLARIDQWIQAHDEALSTQDPRVCKRGRKSLVTAHGDAVVKETIAAGSLGRLRNWLWPGRHAAGYRNAHLLGVLGVGTAKPLAFLRRRGRILTFYEDLSLHERLDYQASRVFGEDPRGAGRALTQHVAQWMADLHARGIYHGDFKAVNVRVSSKAAGPRFLLIDTDRCRFVDGGLSLRRRLKNLAQLAASIPVSATRTERLRFYRHYACAHPMGVSEREVATAVAALLSEKLVVVHEPIE